MLFTGFRPAGSNTFMFPQVDLKVLSLKVINLYQLLYVPSASLHKCP